MAFLWLALSKLYLKPWVKVLPLKISEWSELIWALELNFKKVKLFEDRCGGSRRVTPLDLQCALFHSNRRVSSPSFEHLESSKSEFDSPRKNQENSRRWRSDLIKIQNFAPPWPRPDYLLFPTLREASYFDYFGGPCLSAHIDVTLRPWAFHSNAFGFNRVCFGFANGIWKRNPISFWDGEVVKQEEMVPFRWSKIISNTYLGTDNLYIT